MRSPDFIRPESLQEAAELLRFYGPSAKILGGSTAMTIMLRQKLIAPGELIAISHLPDLNTIQLKDNTLRIGALATHRAIETSELVQTAIPVLADTFGKVANIRIRNGATAGGVLAEADYASDPPAAFLGLDAVVECISPDRHRNVPIAGFFTSFYETALEHDEIITGVSVPIPASGTFALYNKYVSRAAEDRPCVGVFASARTEGKTFTDVRVCVGAASETPQRLDEANAIGDGTPLDDNSISQIADAYASAIDALDDMRGTSWYRREMIRVWVTRSLQEVRDKTPATDLDNEVSSR